MPGDLPDSLTAGLERRPSWRLPLDEHDVAVRLECDGVTAEVAQECYGFGGVHAMAHAWYPQLRDLDEQPAAAPVRRRAWIEHLRGTAFALPLALCCLVMIAFGYSLWGGDLESGAAAAVAIGTVASFVVTGGIVQAMAWQGLFYAGSGDFRMSAVACHRWGFYGTVALLGTVVTGLVFNLQYQWLDGDRVWLAVAFFLALGLLWLGTGLLYIVEAPLVVTAAASCGILLVLGLHGGMGLPLLAAQVAGVLTAAAIATAAGLYILHRRQRGEAGRVYPRMLGRTLYRTAPYLVYGSLYYLLLFADRLIAWTAGTHSESAALIFRGDYELPHDIALIGFILGVGWVHAAACDFHSRVGKLLSATGLDHTRRFNNHMREYHLKRIAGFLPVAGVVNVAVWVVARYFDVLATARAEWIAAIALAAFPFLTVGLWNVSLMFALSRPRAILFPIALAVLLDGGAGYLLSRLISYEHAVIGFLVGAFVFGIGSSLVVQNRLRRLDYFYFVSGA